MNAKQSWSFSKSIIHAPLKRSRNFFILTLLAVIFLTSFKATASTSLVIAEVYGGGGNTSATYRNDYVVIHNPTAAGVDVTGWSIQYQAQSGTAWSVANLNSAIIAPGGYYLIQLASGGAVGAFLPTAEATNSINMSATQGKVALVNTTANLGSQCPSSVNLIDKVAFGTTSTVCNETANASGGSNTSAVQRKDNGCTDTDNNSADFAVTAPNPRNGSSPVNLCGGGGGPLGIGSQPQSLTTNVNRTVTFSVSASGTGPYSYQWQKVGFGNLTDGGNISGATTAVLTISSVSKADEGNYLVTISNLVPETTNSTTVNLTVSDPVIGTQPVSRTNVVGDISDVFATVFGTAPMDYQWYRNGNPVSIGTYTFSLLTNSFSANLTNVQFADQGNYTLIASNSYGAVTTAVASVTVFPTPSTRIARWNFNNNSIAASEGSGTVSLTSTNTASFAAGSFSDPSQIDAPLFNKGWGTTGYPNPGSGGNKTSGIQFGSVSTFGYKDILLTWEQRHSNTASKYARLQYSSNGVDFVDFTVITMGDTNNNFVFFSANLSGIPSVNNNPDFAFRIVTEFENSATGSGANDYVGTVGAYGAGGTIRYDLMSVYGNTLSTVTPIPLTIQQVGTDVVLTWSNPSFKLQAAPLVTGTYTNVTGATSGYTFPITGAQTYFRLVNP